MNLFYFYRNWQKHKKRDTLNDLFETDNLLLAQFLPMKSMELSLARKLKTEAKEKLETAMNFVAKVSKNILYDHDPKQFQMNVQTSEVYW